MMLRLSKMVADRRSGRDERGVTVITVLVGVVIAGVVAALIVISATGDDDGGGETAGATIAWPPRCRTAKNKGVRGLRQKRRRAL